MHFHTYLAYWWWEAGFHKHSDTRLWSHPSILESAVVWKNCQDSMNNITAISAVYLQWITTFQIKAVPFINYLDFLDKLINHWISQESSQESSELYLVDQRLTHDEQKNSQLCLSCNFQEKHFWGLLRKKVTKHVYQRTLNDSTEHLTQWI